MYTLTNKGEKKRRPTALALAHHHINETASDQKEEEIAARIEAPTAPTTEPFTTAKESPREHVAAA